MTPLAGRRVIVTRARAQAGGFAAALEALGAVVVPFPTIRVVPPADERPLLESAAGAGTFDWIVFTSVNGVERFWYALAQQGCDPAIPPGVSLCAIGPATAAALERRGAPAHVVPDEFVAEGVVRALDAADDLRGRRILLPRADIARAVLPEQLRARGAEVVEVAAYSTVPDGGDAERVRALVHAGQVHLLTFTASSTVRGYVDLLGAQTGGAKVASIGPITSATARGLGLPVHVEAAEYTIPGLVQAIRDFYGRGDERGE